MDWPKLDWPNTMAKNGLAKIGLAKVGHNLLAADGLKPIFYQISESYIAGGCGHF